ncbi:copper chaperone PCu(A)C [Rubellimicrobium roseum]|uniref:Copper chaperone PCu(A)C n=1 Tax=Rubellimicrobium roseum TaxID=687525 RepID=A0A5C4N7N2_9RHOB|nr:copper chaperone PCu(A)C [Rubellimicrobium roseum]TNC63554.1 copper chaperone PCu(A)C [Rubellimicrobium roseum]
MPVLLRSALAALLLLAAPAWAHDDAAKGVSLQQGDIGIHDAYALSPRPGAPTGSVFMMIHNHGSTPDRLVGATSPLAERVEIHTHMEEDGVMRMRAVEGGLELPAGGMLLLARGGEHLMFLGVTPPFAEGATVPVTLLFEKAGEVALEVPVDQSRLTGDAEAAGHEGHGG